MDCSRQVFRMRLVVNEKTTLMLPRQWPSVIGHIGYIGYIGYIALGQIGHDPAPVAGPNGMASNGSALDAVAVGGSLV